MNPETKKEMEEKKVWWKAKNWGWGIWSPVTRQKRVKTKKKDRKTKESIAAFHVRRQMVRGWRKLRNMDKIARLKKVEFKLLNSP